MKRVPFDRGGEIRFEDAFSALAGMRGELSLRGGLLFTDSHVASLFGRDLNRALGGIPRFVMPAGERYKSEKTLFSLLKAMAGAGLLRTSRLIAMGGGVVCDLGGLAASLYMRGISCVLVPTTLLAQTDAAIGGKTAIDFCGVKNLVGTFSQPELILSDPSFLRTLPRREIRCGLGEMIKHGALRPSLFEALKGGDLFDFDFLAGEIPRHAAFKAEIVSEDLRESGKRKCLNLGHTTAHVLEEGKKGLSHGCCVLFGLMLEGEIARRYAAADGAFLDDLTALCRRALGRCAFPFGSGELSHLAARALLDKKNTEAGSVTLTVPVFEGEYELLTLPFGEYVRALSLAKGAVC